MKVDMLHMPKSLEYDGLKDAVVCVSYTSDYNIRYISNLILAAVNEVSENKYVEIPTKNNRAMNSSMSYMASDDKVLLANSNYKILISDQKIMFNFLKRYLGWDNYITLIECALNSVNQIVLKGMFLQYMSSFENRDIFTSLDGVITMNQLPSFNGSEFNFSCACHMDAGEAEATVSLINNKQVKETKFSIIKITIASKNQEYNVTQCLHQLAICHQFEKHLFFSLLSEDFINSLRPHYE